MPSGGAASRAQHRGGFCLESGQVSSIVAAVTFASREGCEDMSWNKKGCCCL